MVSFLKNHEIMATTEVFFPGVRDEESEILTALLAQLGYESFWNEEKGLRAYINLPSSGLRLGGPPQYIIVPRNDA